VDGGVRVWVGLGKSDYLLIVKIDSASIQVWLGIIVYNQDLHGTRSSYDTLGCPFTSLAPEYMVQCGIKNRHSRYEYRSIIVSM